MKDPLTRRAALEKSATSALALLGIALLTACGAGASTGAAPTRVPPAPTSVPAATAPPSSAATSATTSASAPAAVTSAAPVASVATAIGAGTTVELGSYFDSGLRNDFMHQVVARFERDNPAVKVTFDPVPSAQYWEKMQTRLASGDPPDVMIGSGATFVGLAQQGAWGAVDGYLKTDNLRLDDYYKQADIFSWQGKQYGLPFMENVTLLAYNKTLFQAASVAPPVEGWTWDDLLQAAQKLTKPGQFGLRVGDGFEFNWLTFLWSNGGEYISSDLKRTMLQMPETVAAFQWMVDLKLKYKVSPPEGDTTLGPGDPFVSGKLAMICAGTGYVPGWLPVIKSFDWGFFPVPTAPRTGKRAVSANGNPYLLAQLSTHPDQAWLLLKHLAGPFTQALIAQTKIAMPTLIAKATDPQGYLLSPPAGMALADANLHFARDLQFHRQWQQWIDAITKALVPAFKGSTTVMDAARQADQIGDAILRTN